MTNTATSDAEIVAKIQQEGWWQGSVIEAGALRSVEPSLPEGFDYWVMASQTCNLYNNNLEKISKVEWVGANKVDKSEPKQKGGRNPRLLETMASHPNGDVWLVCNTQERHWGRRANMARIKPSMALKNALGAAQSERHKDNFAAWLARAYTRLELSNELGHALDKGKFMAAVEKLIDAHEADIFGIFIKVSDDEGASPEHVKPPCYVDLKIVVERRGDLEKVNKKLADLFNAEFATPNGKKTRTQILATDHKIIVDPQAMPAVRWDATLIEQHMRFNFNDYLSGPDEDGTD